jgi:SpoIID/LytB domain protein
VSQTFSVAGATLQLQGGGWGHGRGMSQWGAYQAAVEGRGHAEILAFYYPGTTLTTTSEGQVRVLLTADTGRDLVVRHVPGLAVRHAGAPDGTALEPPAGCAKAPTAWRAVVSGKGLSVQARCVSWQEAVPADTAGTAVAFEVPKSHVPVINGAARRGYRGQVRAERVGNGTRVTNLLPMADYLRTVVPSEVSSAWPTEALAAQAIAARTYAAYEVSARTRAAFDVYDSVRSQAYPGAITYSRDWTIQRNREDARTDAAIAATAGIQVQYRGKPALTQFSSSNGGYTASAPGVAYLQAVPDKWDARASRNPSLSWTVTVDAGRLAARYGLGSLTAVVVTGRDGAGAWGGRITAAELVGTSRTVTLTGDGAIRGAFGVRSANFTIMG